MKLYSIYRRLMSILLLCVCFPVLQAQQGVWKRLLDEPVYGFSINPRNPSTIIVGGLGRTLYKTYDAGKTWSIDSIEFRSGSSQLTNILISSADTNIVLAGGVFNSIRRSTNQGVDWETVFEPEKPMFITPGETIIEHPDNPQILYTGDNTSNRIFRSMDIGKTWDTIGIVNVPSLCTISIRTDSSNIMLAGCKTGIIEKSLDSGKTWQRKVTLRGFNDAEIPKIVFSKQNPLIGYAIIAYFLPKNIPNGGVYKTTDGGETWNEFAMRDTSFWSLGITEIQGKEQLFIGGYSDAAESIPGPGIIVQSDLSFENVNRYTSTIPWMIAAPGETIRKNVWMIKGGGNLPEQQRVYAATESGFFVWEPNSLGIENSRIIEENIRFSEGVLSFHDPLNTLTTITVSSLQGTLFSSISREQTINLNKLHNGVYLLLISHKDGRKQSRMLNVVDGEFYFQKQSLME